ncbi:hypothetical protein KHQ81_15905 (plasmid) [Mycoplasmatota bacterium]|nr:hypothetical protein KHQ81_15905 [Mycoplasmatota bacterium]
MEQLSIFDILDDSPSFNQWVEKQKQNKIEQYYEQNLKGKTLKYISESLFDKFGQMYIDYIKELYEEIRNFLTLTEELFCSEGISKLHKPTIVHPYGYFKVALPKRNTPILVFGMLPKGTLDIIKKKFLLKEKKQQNDFSL